MLRPGIDRIRRIGASSALAIPPFRRLWIAGIVSDAGDWLMFIALPLVVLRLSGSALGTSLAFLLELAPPVLLAPFAARLVDRLPRREVMVTATIAQAAALMPLLAVHDRSDLPLIYAVIVAQAAFAALFEPAKNAVLPTLVGPERAMSANALIGLNNDLGRLVGGSLGGALLATIALRGVTVVDACTYVLASVLIATLPRQQVKSTPAPAGTLRPRSDGGLVRTLADQAIRAPIVVAFVAYMAQGMFVVLFVFFVTDVIGGSATDVGLLRGVQAIGAIAAGAALAAIGARVRALRIALIGIVTFAALSALTWNLSYITHDVALFALMFAAVGVPAVLTGAGLISLLQRASSDALRGSTFAALGLAQAAGQAVGLVAAGVLLGVVGTMPLLQVQAATYGVAAVLALTLLPGRGAGRGGGEQAQDSPSVGQPLPPR